MLRYLTDVKQGDLYGRRNTYHCSSSGYDFRLFHCEKARRLFGENRKAIEKERKEECSPLEFIDAENYENMISGIENFKKSHKKAAIIIFDKENRELTDALND